MQSNAISFQGDSLSLSLITKEVEPPPAGGLVAKVTLAGVCGTDAHRLVGDVPQEDTPVAFGHEAIGIVADLGEGPVLDTRGEPLEVGNRIIWFPPVASCGKCQNCLQDNFLRCEEETWPYPSSKQNPAGFQQYATLSNRVPVYKLENDTPDAAYMALGCALPTAINGLKLLGPIRSTDTVAIQGAGPVGLAFTALAALERPEQLIVIGAPKDRLEWASRLGATAIIDVTTTTPSERTDLVRDLTNGRGVDVAVEAVGRPEAFAEGLDLLAKNGRYSVTGLFSGTQKVEINPVLINNLSLTITGNLGTELDNLEKAVDLASRLQQQFGISDLVTDRFPLVEIESAIRSLASGSSTKTVVVP